MNERWNWMVRYVLVILLAVALGIALGEMALFQGTKVGSSGLTAARLVQFLGFGGALAVFWLLSRRAARLIEEKGSGLDFAKPLLVPFATVVVVACGHAVGLRLLEPLMSPAWHTAYNWTFIGAIILSAAWLLGAVMTGSSSVSTILRNTEPTLAPARPQFDAKQ